MLENGYQQSLDNYYFQLAPVIAAIMGIFISLFIGTEHSDGAFRNKLIVGHNRANIFLSSFFVCFIGCLIITTAWFIGGLPGFCLIDPFEMGLSGFFTYFIIAICMTAAFTVIFVWVSAMSSNKALTVVFVIILFVIMVLVASGVHDRLSVPEFSGGMAYIDGEFVLQEETPNPLYIGGTARTVFEWIRELMPMGQAIVMATEQIVHPVREIIASGITTVVMTALGVLTFRKKDLK